MLPLASMYQLLQPVAQIVSGIFARIASLNARAASRFGATSRARPQRSSSISCSA